MVERAKEMAPPQHTAAAASSTLCKLLAWDADGLWQQVHSFCCGACVWVDLVSCCLFTVCKHHTLHMDVHQDGIR